MSDIVERLREYAATSSYLAECRPRGMINEAADKIEKLRAERDALRALLHEKDRNLVQHALSQQLITRAALGEKE